MNGRVHDAAVVGAGPAGMVAATTLASLGLSTIVLDESPSPGGQIYRAIGTTPVRRPELLGRDYWHGATLVRPFASSGAEYLPGTSVWAVARRADGVFDLAVTAGRPLARIAESFAARAIVIASGALERPLPVPGWTLPGVITAGAVQTLLKSAALVPSGRFVLAGCGPLLWLVAWQCHNAGAPIACVLETIPRGRLAEAMRFAPGFMFSSYVARGMELVRSVRRTTRVIEHVTALEVRGEGRIASVRYAVDDAWTELPADLLALSQGVVPHLHLAAALGCELRWNEQQHCFEPVVDAWGGSTVGGVFIAGDAAGIAGAAAAESRGQLAALGIANALGRIGAARRDAEADRPRRSLAHALRGRAFLDALYAPAAAFRLPEGDTVVCRCEEVTAADIEAAIREGASTPAAIKAATRCGMGPCQGRMCGLTLTALCARSRGVSPAAIGHLRVRFPVRPVTLGELARWPADDEASRAVIRDV